MSSDDGVAADEERVANDTSEQDNDIGDADAESSLLRPLKKSLSTLSWSASGTSLGMKTIGFSGSVVLTVNNITGAGMLTLPQVFQDSGWVLPSLVFLVICVTSTLTATFFTDAMARIRGNHAFDRRLEFSCVVEAFMGKVWKRIALVMLVICLYSQILSGIVATSQILDSFIVFVSPTRTTYALQFSDTVEIINWTAPEMHPTKEGAPCNRSRETPFEDDGSEGMVITLGYLLTMVVLVPFSMQNLEDSIAAQKAAFLLLLCACGVFIWQFWEQGLDFNRIQAFGGSYSGMFGSIIFNYGFIVMIPSWVNEKRPDVSVNKTMWTSTLSATVIYMSVGLLGAAAYDQVSGNFLRSLASHCNPMVTRLSAFIFATVCVGLSVPVFCIMVRYNLTVGMQCGEGAAYVLSTILPWLVSWLFYKGTAFEEVVAWSGQLNNGPVNFVLPLVVSLMALETVCPCLPVTRPADMDSDEERGEGRPGEGRCREDAAGEGGTPEENSGEENTSIDEEGRGGGGAGAEGRAAGSARRPVPVLRRSNSRTRVRPLPRRMHVLQPLIAVVACVLLVTLIGASIAFSLMCVGEDDADADDLVVVGGWLGIPGTHRFQFC